jgi:uncharacterized membrane protein YiaA
MSVPAKPGKVQAIAIMQLVGGILAILTGIWIALASLFLYLVWIYAIVLGILSIIRASKLLGADAYGAGNAKTIAIMQIVNILCCDVPNLAMGIIALVFQSDPEVQAYLEGRPL